MSETVMPAGSPEARSVPEMLPADPAALIDHILRRYHEVHRRELDELIAVARRVETVHAGHPDLPDGLSKLLQHIKLELDMHMCKEEHILFPLMKQGGNAMIGQPISMMMIDHEDHLALGRLLYDMTAGCIAPLGACRTWRGLYDGIRKLLDDLNEHIRIENTILFPHFSGPES